jgi:hypothetical protein
MISLHEICGFRGSVDFGDVLLGLGAVWISLFVIIS